MGRSFLTVYYLIPDRNYIVVFRVRLVVFTNPTIVAWVTPRNRRRSARRQGQGVHTRSRLHPHPRSSLRPVHAPCPLRAIRCTRLVSSSLLCRYIDLSKRRVSPEDVAQVRLIHLMARATTYDIPLCMADGLRPWPIGLRA